MGKRKYVRYVTDEDKKNINPKNIKLWQTYLNGKRKLAETTRDSYSADMMQFFTYILKNYDNKYLFDMDEMDSADLIEDYISMCTFAFENSDRRIARRMSTISSMYIYFKKKRKIKFNPVELMERPEIKAGIGVMKQTFLSEEQVEEIRIGLREFGDDQMELFFELGLFTMLRVNALSNILIKNIDFENKKITEIKEKEGYIVTAMLNNRSIELINKVLEARGVESDLLFVNKNGSHAKSSMQNHWITKIGKYIGLDLHCHDLRHSRLRPSF
jgi:integrase/recombinase XerC